jgi:hypothetical protein
MGLKVTCVFKRNGKRIEIKKIKRGKLPKRQRVTKKEIIEYLLENYKINIIEGKKQQ